MAKWLRLAVLMTVFAQKRPRSANLAPDRTFAARRMACPAGHRLLLLRILVACGVSAFLNSHADAAAQPTSSNGTPERLAVDTP